MGNWYAAPLSRRMCASIRLFSFFFQKKGKDRREQGGFIGAPFIQQQLKDGPKRRRVGLVVEGAPARRKFFKLLFFSSSSLKQ